MSPPDRHAPLESIMARKHLPALDGLRALAVFTVMAYHYTSDARIPGDLGVSAFFVLSGFLITWLLVREQEGTGGVSLQNFYARRTLRIFPAYYVYVTFSLLVDTVRGHPWTRELIVCAYAYVVNYFNALHNHPTTSVAHAWSLAVEEQFYLLWPALFIWLWGKGRDTARSAVLGIVVAVLAWRSFLFLSGRVGSAYAYNAFDTRFDNLAIGCWLALNVGRPWLGRLARAVTRGAWMPLVTVAVLLLSRLGGSRDYHYSIGFTIDALLLAVLLVQLLVLSASPVWRWLDHPVPRYLGVISYPLYLYHGWGGSVGAHMPGFPTPVQVAVSVAASIVIASGSYFLVEKPFLRLKRRWETVRHPAESSVAPVVGT